MLLGSSRPRTLDEIAAEVPGYPSGHGARRQAFERDKRLLREEGIPVRTEPVEGPEQFGYRIDPEDFYLPELQLEPDEQAALHLAVAGVHLGDPSGRDALAKLGALGVADVRPVAAVVPPPALVALFDAVRTQSVVRFPYRGEGRSVAPATLRFKGGRWYLVGWDTDRSAVRTFRIDRIDGSPQVGVPESGRLPEGVVLAQGPDDPWRPADDEEEDAVVLVVDPVEAPRVVAEVGDAAVVERRPDGSVLLRLGVTSAEAMRSWVLGLLDHAEVVAPPAVRADLVRWLEAVRAVRAVRAAGPVGDGGPPAPSAPPATTVTSAPASAPGTVAEDDRRPGPHGASTRLRRLLAIVGWLARVGEAPIAEVSDRFGIPADQLVHELELAACCGLPPYSPDQLLEIVVTDDTVQAFLPAELARPRRLTAAEGLALAAAARTILAVPGADHDGALARALAKLEGVLGVQQRLVVDLDRPALLEEARAAVGTGTQLRLEYHSASTDETTDRTVDPLAVVALDGHWYLDAYCHRSAGVRRFRVDRIRQLERLLTPAEHHVAPEAGRPEAFVPGPGSTEVRLVVGPAAAWVLDSVPALGVRRLSDGTTELVLAVGGRAWLERLLLQLGPDARVVAPPELIGAAAQVARRVLRRYDALNNMR